MNVTELNAHLLAERIHGREYGSEITKDEEAIAKYAGLVVVFGASDDLMEFRGAIHDELGAYEGTTAYLTGEGLLQNECNDDDCPHFKKLKENAATIKAVWNDSGEGFTWEQDGGGFTWTYETSIPHATFEIHDGDEKYCRGIVFSLKDVVTA